MKVNELVINEDFEKNVIKTKYIKFEIKESIADNVLFYGIIDGNLNYVDMYKEYVKNIFNVYTNIEYGEDDYDNLKNYNGVDIIELIMGFIEKDLKELNLIIRLKVLSYKEENSLENKLISVAENITNNFDKYIDQIKDKISEIDLKKFDIENFKNKFLFDKDDLDE